MKKNIWMFHHYATPPNMSGLIRPYEFSKELKNFWYRTTVFASAYLHYTSENLITNKSKFIKYTFEEIPFIFVNSPEYKNNGLSRVHNMGAFAFNLFSIGKSFIKKGERPDVIYASSPHPLTLIAGLMLGKVSNTLYL